MDILKRFFGGLRGIRVENVGANRATFYKIIMPHSARGCGEIRWLMDEQMVKLKVGVVTFNSALEHVGGGKVPIFPARPKEGSHRF